MFKRRPKHRLFRVQSLLICTLLAIALRALTPAGYMVTGPGDGGGDLISVTLCGSGANIALDLGDHEAPAQNNAADGGACVFAANATASHPAIAGVSAPAPVAAPAPDQRLLPRTVALGHGLAAPPPPSHAPPVLV